MLSRESIPLGLSARRLCAARDIVFRRIRGSDRPDESRLSLALHDSGSLLWPMLERRANGIEVVEHAMGPILDKQAGAVFVVLRQILPAMAELPRPDPD